MVALTDEQIELTLGDQRVVLDPTGGGLRAYDVAGSPCSTRIRRASRARPAAGRS